MQYTKKVFVQREHVWQRVVSYDVSSMRVLIFSRVGGTETARGVGFLFVELVPPGRKVPTAWHLICAGSISAILVPS